MILIKDLKIKLFADGADIADMKKVYQDGLIKGFTTNPTLMRKNGIVHYENFAKEVLRAIPDRPISFEVFSDDFTEMERQALKIAGWGKNVYVKIPVMNTQRVPTYNLIKTLTSSGVKVNVTAVMTVEQVREIVKVINKKVPSYVSVFAGRIADTGRDPLPIMVDVLKLLQGLPKTELIWASPRELLNIFQADAIGCHIITVTNDVLKKLACVGKDLDEFSLDTVKMFHDDARAAGYVL